MGLFSNLLGNSGKDLDNALNKMKNLADDILDDGQINNQPSQPSSHPFNAEPIRESSPASTFVEEAECGDSWGPVMPSEPNQFNSGLAYDEYFTNLFNEVFASSYQIDAERVRNRKAMVYTFSQEGEKKLVVEVISTKTSPYKLRKDCRAQGLPYLRYYYDHDGWWNTKSYVTRRTAKALGKGK